MSGNINTTGQTQNQTANQLQNGTQSQNQTSTLTPYAQSGLSGILSNLSGINPNLNATQSGAIGQLTNLGAAGNPFSGAISNVANNLLSGGDANAQAPLLNSAYSQYQQQLSPYLQSSYLDPRNTPGFGAALSTMNNDITNQVNSQFARAGRDLSGMNTQTLARGLSQGEGGLIQGQYNQNVANQLGAAGSLYGAGNTTAGLLTGLNQLGLQNQQAGAGVANQANTASQYGPLLQLQAQSMQTGIPLANLAAQAGIALPAASAFGTQTGSGTGTSTGTMQGTANTVTQNTAPLWQQIAGGLLGGGALLGGNQGLLKALGGWPTSAPPS
jgi:hypothetical protein